MDKGYEKEPFKNLSIKVSVVKKFRRFCKALSRSQSMTLLLMIEFFEHNGISPKESIGPNMQTLESLIKKRINAVVAMMKDMEKHQTKPTVAMLQSLFENMVPAPARKTEKKLWREKKGISPQKGEKGLGLQLEEIREELEYYKDRCARMEKAYSAARADLKKVLGHVKTIRPPLAKPYLRLELSPEMITHLKSKFNLN